MAKHVDLMSSNMELCVGVWRCDASSELAEISRMLCEISTDVTKESSLCGLVSLHYPRLAIEESNSSSYKGPLVKAFTAMHFTAS